MDRARLRAAAAGALIALAAALVAAAPAVDGLRGLSIDLLTMLRWHAFGNAHPPAASPAVVIALDEETFRTPPFAGSPSVAWTPELARVLNAVIDGGATVVGFDVIFPTSIEQSAVPFGDETLGSRLHGFDRDFLRALALGARAGKVVLGEAQHQASPVLPSPGQRAAVGFTRNIRPLNVFSDADGVIRRVPLAFMVDGARLPSISVELAARAGAPPPQAGVADTLTLAFAAGAGDIPTYSLADLRACAEKGDTDFFRKHFAGKVVLIGTVLDVEDRKITSTRFALAPEGARGARCALAPPAAAQTFIRDSISGVYIQATAVNNLIRGEELREFGRLGSGLAALTLAALAVAAALTLGPASAALGFLGLALLWTAGATLAVRDALVLPLVEPLATSFVALGGAIGYRLLVADRIMAAQRAQQRLHEAEMASAPAIQRALLPRDEAGGVAADRLDIFAHMTPAREVGGDLYDIVELGQDRVAITIGDVCGKGIPASLFMAITQTVMRLALRTRAHLPGGVKTANDLLVANNTEDMFTTLFCGVIDVPAGTLTYCNCGHNPPLLLRPDAGAFETLPNCGPPLAVIEGITYAPRTLALAPGDLLLLYTDGVTEAEDPQTAQFGMQRLQQAILEARGTSARRVVEHLVARVAAFANGAPQSDDITCVAVLLPVSASELGQTPSPT